MCAEAITASVTLNSYVAAFFYSKHFFATGKILLIAIITKTASWEARMLIGHFIVGVFFFNYLLTLLR